MQIIFAKEAGEYILEFFSGFFGTPALLIGLFALLGCIIQRKKFSEIVISTFKTIIGFLIISGGAGIIGGAIDRFGKSFVLLFNRSGFIGNNDILPGFFLDNENLVWIATAGSLILIFAMLLNLILAKISHLKYIWLTGQGAWYFSTMVASICAVAGIQKSEIWLVVIVGSLLVSMYMVISPSLLNKHMKEITKTDNLAMGHTGSMTYFLAGEIGNFVHKVRKGKVKSTEEINVPKGLAFLKNTNVSIALTMLIFYFVVYFSAWGVRGEEAMVEAEIITRSQSVIVQGIVQAFTFAAGVEVLLIGVRMFIAEITPAFKGISDKWIRDAKPAVDCPIVFTFAPNAVILGFIGSLIGGIVFFGINIGISASLPASAKILSWSAIIIPSIVPHFFTGATAGVFGNAKGGIWGCVLGSFINGILIQILPWIFVGLAGIQEELAIQHQVIWGDADYILGFIPWLIVKYLGGQYSLLGISVVLWLLIPSIGLVIHQYKMNHNEQYKLNYETEKKLHWELKTLKKEKGLVFKQQIVEIKNNEIDKKMKKEQINEIKTNWNQEKIKLDEEFDQKLLDSRKVQLK